MFDVASLICESESSLPLDARTIVCDSTKDCKSPIDDYYSYSSTLYSEVTKAGGAPTEDVMRLLLLGQVSAVEFFVRRLIGGLVSACPISKKCSQSAQISLAALTYVEANSLEFALFENKSFASAKEMREATQKMIGVQIKDNSSVAVAIDEFDKLCVLRHAAVHSRGQLSPKNVMDLGLSVSRPLKVNLAPLAYQYMRAVCHNVVRAYNKYLFSQTLIRLKDSGQFSGVWSEDKALFDKIFLLFHSKNDAKFSGSSYQMHRRLSADFAKASSAMRNAR